jgi:hypothetical protein
MCVCAASPTRPLIDVTDVCATIAKYLDGVDIPFNNIGIMHNFYGMCAGSCWPRNDVDYVSFHGVGAKSNVKFVKALKQNLHQLSKTAAWRGKLDSRMELDVQTLLQARYTAGDDKLVEQMLIAARTLKHIMYDTMDVPTMRVLSSTAILVALLAITFELFFGVKSLVNLVVHQPLRALAYLVLFCFIILAPLSHLLFMSTHWVRVFRQGTVFYLPSLGLAFVQVALLARLWHRSQVQARVGNESPLSNLCYAAISMIVINESINWLLLALSLVFRGHWKAWFTACTGSRELVYALSLALAYVQLLPQRQAQPTMRARNSYANMALVTLIIGLLLAYEWTESYNDAYVVFGFHACFAAAAIIGAAAVVYQLVYHRTVAAVSPACSMLLLVLWMDSNTGRMLHLIWIAQGLLLQYPMLELLCVASRMLHSPAVTLHHLATNTTLSQTHTPPSDSPQQVPEADDDSPVSNTVCVPTARSTSSTSSNSTSSSRPGAANTHSSRDPLQSCFQLESRLLILATFVYIANSVYYHLAVNMGDRVSLDVHPFVGMHDDEHQLGLIH